MNQTPMRQPKKTWAILVLALFAAPVVSDTFEEGKTAYRAKDYERAFKILKPLAEEGDPEAQKTIGLMYEYGRGTPKDESEATTWYTKAALQGDPVLQHDLGIKYFTGQGVSQDYEAAAKWWQMAADAGLAKSQANLGIMYYQGLGVEKNYVEAARLFRAAAEQDLAQGQYNLGLSYEKGNGVPQDYAEALTWYEKAANQELALAQYRLGNMYEHGHGTEKNAQEADRWYQLAADHGLEQAEQAVKTQEREARLPPPQKEAAGTRSKTLNGDDWVRAQDPSHYTLQLTNVGNEKAVVKFIKQNGLEHEAVYIKLSVDGVTRFAALYGIYRTHDEADKARGTLKAPLREARPWIRNFSELQALIRP